MKNKHTFIQFDYGYYSEEHEWILNNSLSGILLKTSKITYSLLVENICKKIVIDETSRKVKLSYILCTSQRETSIVDDDDFLGYLMVVNAKGIRPALHVEVVNKESERVEQISRVEGRSSVGVNYEELNAFDVDNGGVVTIFGGEIVGEEAMENAVIDNREHVDSRMDSEEDNGVDGRIEYYELSCAEHSRQTSAYATEYSASAAGSKFSDIHLSTREERPEFDDLCKYNGEYGVPTNCFCGKHLDLEERIIDNQKKTFLKCPMSGQDHIDKCNRGAIHQFCAEIEKLKDRLDKKDVEIVQLMDALGKK
ncbi:unnamed protein product [Arabidopsis thaliana]|uniref:(thale cress) hypothetical protein n=1 Tax=Arabidopsis thaliana TaxID=3702 RepID=A0A7G2FHB0_ARATH|nr:unnamed protein product [Arabidopsis thaliana]